MAISVLLLAEMSQVESGNLSSFQSGTCFSYSCVKNIRYLQPQETASLLDFFFLVIRDSYLLGSDIEVFSVNVISYSY